MSKCNILPVMEPIIASNTEHGYLLSGVQTNPLSTEWLMNNFMHQVLHGMNLKPDMNFYPITTHTVCPCIDYLRVSKVMVIQKWNSVCDFLIENINNKYYVILHLDWFFISGSSTYQQKNYLHPVLIYGYNRHTQKFMAGDFNQFLKFTFFEIPFYEIEQGFKLREGESHLSMNVIYILMI